jgi:hypothetical protein
VPWVWHFLFDSSSLPPTGVTSKPAHLSLWAISKSSPPSLKRSRELDDPTPTSIRRHTPPSPFLTQPSPPAPTLLSSTNQLYLYTIFPYSINVELQLTASRAEMGAETISFFSRTAAWRLGRFWRRSVEGTVEGTVVLLYIPPNQCFKTLSHYNSSPSLKACYLNSLVPF